MLSTTNPVTASIDPRAVRQGQRVVLVTGPSGAGRSTAINVLEDLGFESIDNLPLSLIPRLIDGPSRPDPMALGLDVRNRDFSSSNVVELIDRLTRNPDFAPEVLYLDCSPDILVRRYNETRRRHPLAPDGSPRIGITRELDLLAPVKARADVLIDTSELTPHELKAELARWFETDPNRKLSISLHSFSYKRGVPRGIDMMFDCRFLANPHWEHQLRSLNGTDLPVQEFVEADPRYTAFFDQVHALIGFLLPAYKEEGKTHFSVGFGCTGGQHRSVTLVEKMSVVLAEAGWQVSIRHRELERRLAMPAEFGEDLSGEASGPGHDKQMGQS